VTKIVLDRNVVIDYDLKIIYLHKTDETMKLNFVILIISSLLLACNSNDRNRLTRIPTNAVELFEINKFIGRNFSINDSLYIKNRRYKDTIVLVLDRIANELIEFSGGYSYDGLSSLKLHGRIDKYYLADPTNKILPRKYFFSNNKIRPFAHLELQTALNDYCIRAQTNIYKVLRNKFRIEIEISDDHIIPYLLEDTTLEEGVFVIYSIITVIQIEHLNEGLALIKKCNE
jgi:hypothetical protein